MDKKLKNTVSVVLTAAVLSAGLSMKTLAAEAELQDETGATYIEDAPLAEEPAAEPEASPAPSEEPEAAPSPEPSPEAETEIEPAPTPEPEPEPATDPEPELQPAIDPEPETDPAEETPAEETPETDPAETPADPAQEETPGVEEILPLPEDVQVPEEYSDAAAYAYSYLRQLGFSEAVSCGILANIEYESSFNPMCLGDNGTSYGLLQWHNERWTRLFQYCSEQNLNPATIQGQLEYLVWELQNYETETWYQLGSIPNTAEGAAQAAQIWCVYFERPSDPYGQSQLRAASAMFKFWPKFGMGDDTRDLGSFDENSLFFSTDPAAQTNYTQSSGYSSSTFFVDYMSPEDVEYYGNIDPSYTGCAILNLTDLEKQAIINTLVGEQGDNLVGCMYVAQILHDEYVYLGGQYDAFSSLFKTIFTSGLWDTSYWNVAEVNPYGVDTSVAEFAFDYIFNQGNAFVRHNLVVDVNGKNHDDPVTHYEGAEKVLTVRRSAGQEDWAQLWGNGFFNWDRLTADNPINGAPQVAWSIRETSLTTDEIEAAMAHDLYLSDEGAASCSFDGYVHTAGRHEGIDFVNYPGAPVYSLVTGQVIRVSQGGGGLSTLAIYDLGSNHTVIYLHADIDSSIHAGDMVHRGQLVGTEAANGTTAAHTHVELRSGRQYFASVSVNDQVLENATPYYFWEQLITSGGNKMFLVVPESGNTEAPAQP